MDTTRSVTRAVTRRPAAADVLAVATRLERLAAHLPPELQAQATKTAEGLILHARFLRQHERARRDSR